MRIFVIDDEPDVAETLGEVVADLGHQASVAYSVDAALTDLERCTPDAILLDLRLPGTDGLEFLRRRRRWSPPPVIGISGVATDTEVWECLRLGAVDFVRKPFTIELLEALVRYVTARQPDRGAGGRPRVEHRRSARVRLTTAVTVVERAGSRWQSVSIDLSVFGIKLRPRPAARPAEHARLLFTPPAGGPGLDLFAVLVREDARGWAYRFVNLAVEQFERLQRLVAEIASRPPRPSAPALRPGLQSGTLRIVRRTAIDASPGGYALTLDSARDGNRSRRCATQGDLLAVLTDLRVSRAMRITAMLDLAAGGSVALHVVVTDDELRQVGFTRP
jgi:DNA-binding response OmpR family regulator